MIHDYNYFSHALMHPTTVKVVMPDVRTPDKTMYFLHGAMSDAKNCLDNVDMQKLANQYQMAVVLPSCGNTFYIDHGPAFGNYGRFVGNELPDVIRGVFGLSPNREDTAVAGFSMGGYGAIRSALKYHKNFGYVICLSGAFLFEKSAYTLYDSKFAYFMDKLFKDVFKDKMQPGPGCENYKYYLEKNLRENKFIPKFYISCGRQEPLKILSDEFHEYLSDIGIEHVFVTEEGDHDWELWKRLIIPAVEWFAEG